MAVTQDQPVPPQTPEKGEPDSPSDLPARDWKAGLKGAFAQFKQDKGTLVAAGMAFFWFLAVFPGLLAAVGVTGILHVSQETIGSISRAIQSTLPGDASKVLTDALGQASRRAGGSSAIAAVIGVVVALWSASAGMVATQTGLDVVYDVGEERTFVQKRARALLLIAVALVLGGIATAAIVFGAPIGNGIREHLPFGDLAFLVVWTAVRWIVGLGALTALFAAFYYLGPNRETPKWTWLSPGGAVAAVIWLLASLGFSLYVTHLGSYGKTYGSLTGVVVLLTWMYLSAIAVVLGGEINAEMERQGEGRRRRERRRNGRDQGGSYRPTHEAPPPSDGHMAAWEEHMAAIRTGRSR